MWRRKLLVAARPILQEYDAFKSGSKGLTSGSKQIPLGCGDLILRHGLAELVGEMLTESIVGG